MICRYTEEGAAVAGGTTALPHQADGIDHHLQRAGAAILAGLRIKDPRFSERQLERLRPRGILSQQEAKVGRGPVRGGQSKEHAGAR